MRAIKRCICLEELKSRIPGLFPYIEFDEFGRVVKHKATDSVDGCYGKIIPDFGNVSYRTLISDYYKGNNRILVEAENEQPITVEDAIGKFRVNLDDYDETQTLVPDYVYASETKELLDKMVKLKKFCISYELNGSFCCECSEFNERGGDTMIAFLTDISQRAEAIADSLFDVFGEDASVSFNVNLDGTFEDIGYYTMAESIGCGTESHNIGVSVTDGKIKGTTDSKLKSFRRYTTYTNDNGITETPDSDSDWLYFYRVGYVSNYETLNEDNGNISFLDNGVSPQRDSEKYVVNLEAYGNVLTGIERDKENRELRFTYCINAHLKAKQSVNERGIIITGQDDDGNILYYYDYPFVYHSGGVIQTETYTYAEGGDIDTLTDADFGKLISLYTKQGGKLQQDFAKTTNKKYEFFTVGSDMSYEKTLFDKKVNIKYGYSSFEYDRPDVSTDTGCYTLFKEDYLMGVHFKPSVSSTVNIQRGNNAAFERHIRLGEVKTLEDMENYQNGSFFNIKTLI